jgi:hypothetical protein
VVSLTQRGGATAAAWQAEYHKLATLLFGDLAAAERADLITGLGRVLGKLRASAAASPDSPASKRTKPKGKPASA